VQWSGVRWTAVDDAKLLIGVYEHGLGNWESIRSDPELGLSSKILPANKSMKPQSSHLQTRVEYLLKLLQEEAKRKAKARIVSFSVNCWLCMLW
jgi:chromodomain-helicase-DNA-binding protein 1